MGFFHASYYWVITFPSLLSTFNSLYLGFFHASTKFPRSSFLFSFFQFPLLGIFPCIFREIDFDKDSRKTFQFPLLGIFPCIRCRSEAPLTPTWIPFNSLYLGFFHASLPPLKATTHFPFSFNSLYLGFFHASLSHSYSSGHGLFTTFNSLYLGFFHASGREIHICIAVSIPFNSLYLGFFHASDLVFGLVCRFVVFSTWFEICIVDYY